MLCIPFGIGILLMGLNSVAVRGQAFGWGSASWRAAVKPRLAGNAVDTDAGPRNVRGSRSWVPPIPHVHTAGGA